MVRLPSPALMSTLTLVAPLRGSERLWVSTLLATRAPPLQECWVDGPPPETDCHLLVLASSITQWYLTVIVKTRDLRLIEKDRCQSDPFLHS